MRCLICKKEIPYGKSFTDPKNHEPNCPIHVDTETLKKEVNKLIDSGE